MRSGIVMIMHRADAWSMLGMARILAVTLATKGCMFDRPRLAMRNEYRKDQIKHDLTVPTLISEYLFNVFVTF